MIRGQRRPIGYMDVIKYADNGFRVEIRTPVGVSTLVLSRAELRQMCKLGVQALKKDTP